jgi:hypothetical protein
MTMIIPSSPTVARVGITGPVILTVCIRIELGAPTRIVNYVLRRGRGDNRGQQRDSAHDRQSRHGGLPCFRVI